MIMRTTWASARFATLAPLAVVFGLLLALPLSATLVSPALANETTKAFSAHAAGSTKTIDHSAWTSMLATYVVKSEDGVNRVDYAAWQATDRRTLKGYVAALEAVDPSTLDRAEQFAFWANLYNAKTIDIVLDNYPIASIREISIGEGLFGFLKKSVGAGGPWKAKIVKVSGRELSLDDIEHEIMRPVFKDPRVHYAVNCASFGCPNLAREALTGAKLEAQLDAGARAFVNNPRGFSVEGGTLKASSIYNWFKVDFGGTDEGVLDHARAYASDDLRAKLDGKTSIDGYGYDWSLNTIKRGS